MRRIIPIITLVLLTTCTPRYTIDHSRPVRPLSLPRDDAAHYTAKTEWWYYTGHLTADDGSAYGFEVTFFKRLTGEDKAPACLFRMPAHWIKEVAMLGHFAITDLGQKQFKAAEIHNLARKWKADSDRYHVFINGWSVEANNNRHLLKASMKDYSLDLALTPRKPAAMNGPDGILDKGVNTNYYYSYTNIDVEGTLTVRGTKKTVTGKAWMDHEFGPMDLITKSIGWDWFSIQMDNDTEIMIYLIKDKDRIIPHSGGTYVDSEGRTRLLSLSDIDVSATGTWTSPKTKAVYPAGWNILVRPLDLQIRVKPLLAEQELTLKPVTYWEGAVTVEGTVGGKAVAGKGYVELVGYDKKSSFDTYKNK